MRLRYTLPALSDLESVVAYMADHSPQGLRRLKSEVDAVQKLIATHPKAGVQTRLDWLRRIKIPSFPYLMFYEVSDTEVIVHAVRHGARDPASMPDAP